VAVDHENFNVLRLTEASREVLKGERRLTLRRDAIPAAGGRRTRRPAKTAADAAAEASPQDEAVFQALREWRRSLAREHGVPAYTVMHDATLREIASRLPEDVAGLAGISGIGTTKLARYGDAIIEVIRTARQVEPA
jgi:ATP-dependent DNA helicase RecQ